MLKNKEYLAKGKRSIVYKGLFKGKKAVQKFAKKGSPPNILKNEAKWIKKLSKFKISPKLYASGKDYIITEFLDGEPIMKWIKKHQKKDILKVLNIILHQCRALDKIKVNKKELQRPVKHIIISKGTPKMIDFERCKETINPKNVTQFCQFITSKNMQEIFQAKKINLKKERLIQVLKSYKKKQNNKNFQKILKEIQS